MKNIPYHYCFCGYRYVSSLCLWHRLTGFIMQMNHCSTRHNPNEFGLCSRLHRVSKGISLWLNRAFLALRSNAWRKRPIELWYFCLNTLGERTCILQMKSPFLFRWLHHPPCGLNLLLLLYRLCRLGQGLTAQVVVQVLILTIVHWLVKHPFPELLFQLLAGAPSSRVVVKETADLGVGFQ